MANFTFYVSFAAKELRRAGDFLTKIKRFPLVSFSSVVNNSFLNKNFLLVSSKLPLDALRVLTR